MNPSGGGPSANDWDALHEYGKLTVMFGLDRWMDGAAIESLYRDCEGWLRARFRDGTEWGPVHRDDNTTIGWISWQLELLRKIA